MPINKKKMNALKKQYGEKKGKEVYFSMETQQKFKTKKGKKK